MDQLIVNAALTGCVAHKADNPALPVTPEEVAADARRCADEGAAIFHVHARDRHGNATFGTGTYRRYVDAVREAVPGAIVCASTSGRHFTDFEERAQSLYAKPDMASLTLGSVDFEHGSGTYSRSQVRAMLRRMLDLGVKPEFEAFDLGHAYRLRDLVAEFEDDLEWPYANLILGVHLPPTREVFYPIMQQFEEDATWSATSVGRGAEIVQRWAIAFGAHVRVGLEDSLWMDKGVPATNPALVARAVAFGRSLGREPATFEQAREELGL